MDESTEIEAVGTAMSIDREEVDIQIATAKRYPRDVKKAIASMEEMACMNKEVAESCFYAYQRAGKLIEGPSVRLAEISLSFWKNVRSKSRILEEGKKDITVECITWDMESNILVSQPCRRRIVDKNNMKFSTDMILTATMAAVSIAFRNSTFRVIPRPLIDMIYRKARDFRFGDLEAITRSRTRAIETFGKLGVSQERIFAALEDVETIEDIGAKELSTLRGALTAIREKAMTIEEAFPPVPPKDGKGNVSPATSRTESLKAKLKKQKEKEQDVPDHRSAPPADKAAAAEAKEAHEQNEESMSTPSTMIQKIEETEPVYKIVKDALEHDVPDVLLSDWMIEFNIRSGDLRSQSVKRLVALEKKIDYWLNAQGPGSFADQNDDSKAKSDEGAQNQHSPEDAIKAIEKRIENVMEFTGEAALNWIGETLGHFIDTLDELTPEHISGLNEVLDMAENEGNE